ncbi:MAG: trypsin-like serine protease [Acidobacteria bacterium]|nr:trypsin-like serine protease [Acidobacteriota bacterium]
MRRSRFIYIIYTFLFLCLFDISLQAQNKSQQQRTPSTSRVLTANEIAQKAFPSVVEIITETSDGKPDALGSGFFVEGKLIATNYHVIENASVIYARTVGQKRFFKISKVDRVDQENDLALLRVEGFSVKPLPLGDSKQVKVGNEVYAVGNPEGFSGTFSQGIISGLRRSKLIQITAPVSHGSSGGPVLNKRGEVIGVVSSSFQEGQNLNFAVSVTCLISLLKSNEKTLLDSLANGSLIIKEADDPFETLSAKALFEKGKMLLKDNRETAKSYFEAAVKKDPDYADAWVELGDYYSFYSFKDKLKSADNYIKAIRADPNHFDAHIGLGHAYREYASTFESKSKTEALMYYRKSVDSYQQATLLKPNNALAYALLGLSLTKSLQNAKANEAFSKALQLAPNDPEILEVLSNMYLHLHRYQDALNTSHYALRVAPNDWLYKFHQILGEVYEDMGKTDKRANDFFQKAIENYKAAIRLSPNNYFDDGTKNHYNLGRVYLLIGDRNSALNEYAVLKKKSSFYADKLFKEIYK